MPINSQTPFDLIPEPYQPDAVIVTQHMGAVQWLAEKGIRCQHLVRANRGDVRGKTVYGVVPLPLAAYAKDIYIIEMPQLRKNQTRVELTPAQMDKAGAVLVHYRVERLER